MTYEELIKRLDPAVYQSLRRAVELGKWPDGRRLSDEQRSICMEAIIHYEKTHDLPESERVGYIERQSCGSDKGSGEDTIRIVS